MTQKKEAKNALDLLLGVDIGVVAKPRKEIHMPRLSKQLGQDVVFTIEALSADQFETVQDNALKISGKNVDVRVTEMQIFTLIEGVVEPSFKNKELRNKFGAPTPKELVKKLLISGEIQYLYQEITALSGFGDEDDIKN